MQTALQKNQLLTDEDALWKPINKQAALIVRPAPWLSAPTVEKRFLPSAEEIAAQKVKEAQESAAAATERANLRLRQLANRARRNRHKVKPAPAAKCLWAKNQLRAIHARKGLPPPTWDEIRAYRQTQPTYGQPLTAK